MSHISCVFLGCYFTICSYITIIYYEWGDLLTILKTFEPLYAFICDTPGLEHNENDENCAQPITLPLLFALFQSIAVLWRHANTLLPILIRMFLWTG